MRPFDRTAQRGTQKKSGGFRINEEIRIRQVRLVDADGTMAGVVPTDDAMRRAREAALDLVEVSPNADPPVCKILDYGKFKYEQKKRDHEAKRKQRGGDFKEIRFRPKTERHDLEIKMNRVRRFLLNGDRVQITMVFRGREMQNIGKASEVLNEFAKKMEDVAKVERSYSREGRRAFIGLMPKPGLKKDTKEPTSPQDDEDLDDDLDDDIDDDDDGDEGQDVGEQGESTQGASIPGSGERAAQP